MIRSFAAIASATLILASCASTGPRLEAEDYLASPALGEKVDRICFTRNIDRFGDATRNTLIVEEGVNDFYLIEVFGACQQLDWAQSLAFTRTRGSCLLRGDRLITFDSAFPNRSDLRFSNQCTIKAIYEWDRDKLGEDGVTKVSADGEADDETRTAEDTDT
ncbi:MAG: DUF6491 family protein [Pseudomonadota bacterium]